MDRREIIAELRDVIGSYIKEQGLDLVDLVYRYEGGGLFLRILVDKPEGGISLDDCAYINNEISRILDEKNILQERYILEVASPGLDRPLTTKKDFLRCMNKKARFFLNELVEDRRELEGIINSVDDEAVYIDSQGRVIKIPLSKINKAKRVINNI
jgi:ribosome maturation factor RimP